MFNFFIPTRFLVGIGKLKELHSQEFPGKKAMIVISNGKSTRINGSLDRTVAELKMSDYGITEDELDTLAKNARETMGGLFGADPAPMSHEECVAIYKRSYI